MGIVKTTKSIFNFYLQGFKSMSRSSKQLWIIILIKLFIMFFVLKLFFFNDTLGNRFENDKERSEHVIDELTKTKNK